LILHDPCSPFPIYIEHRSPPPPITSTLSLYTQESLYTGHPPGILIYGESTGKSYIQGIHSIPCIHGIHRESLYTGNLIYRAFTGRILSVLSCYPGLHSNWWPARCTHLLRYRSIFVFYHYISRYVYYRYYYGKISPFFFLLILQVIFWVQYQIMPIDSKHSDSTYVEPPSKSHHLGVLDLVRKCALCMVCLWCRLHTFTLN